MFITFGGLMPLNYKYKPKKRNARFIISLILIASNIGWHHCPNIFAITLKGVVIVVRCLLQIQRLQIECKTIMSFNFKVDNDHIIEME